MPSKRHDFAKDQGFHPLEDALLFEYRAMRFQKRFYIATPIVKTTN
jgi:hypothetical protein